MGDLPTPLKLFYLLAVSYFINPYMNRLYQNINLQFEGELSVRTSVYFAKQEFLNPPS